MPILYFAYGSNMLPERLRARCESARVVGIAHAIGYELEFSKVSNDGSGKATLSNTDGGVTPGVLYEIERSELPALDGAEGVGFGYNRVTDFAVEGMGTGEHLAVTTYVGSRIDRRLKPYDWYLALVIAGALHQRLDDAHIASLKRTEFLLDRTLDRDARRDAVEALKAHGFDDYNALLKLEG